MIEIKLHSKTRNKSRKILGTCIYTYVHSGRKEKRREGGRRKNGAWRNKVRFYKELGLELCLKIGRI